MNLENTLESPAETPLNTPVDGFSSGEVKRAARNAMAMALASLVAKGMLFLWQLILARWLGSAGYGTYGTIGAMLSIGAALPEFGMGVLVVRDVAQRPQDAGRYWGAMLVIQPLLAGVGYIMLAAAALLLLGYDAELRALLALAAFSLWLDAMGNMCHNQLLAFERMVIPALISIGHILSLITLAALALGLGAGLWGLYAATLGAGLLRAGVYWWVLLRTGTRPHLPVDRAVARSLLINGAPIALSSFLALTYTHADKLLTTALIGKEGTGQLTAGFVIVFGVIDLLSTTVLVAVFPMMSRTHGSAQRAMFEFMLEKLSFFNLMISLPIAIFTSLLAVPLAALAFGPEYTRTADVLQVLIWYTVVTMVANVFAQAMMIENRQVRLLIIRAGGLIVTVILNLILLPVLGVPGAAVASLAAEILVLTVLLRQFTLPGDWWSRSRDHVWRLGVCGLGLAVVILLLRTSHPLLAVIGGAPVYLMLIVLMRVIAPDDWDLIYRMLIAMPGGALIGRYWKRQLV